LRALGVTTSKRLSSLPEVPTIAEAGVPGYDMAGWYGILAPTATPKSIRSKLNSEIVNLLRAPELLQKLSSQEAIVIASSEEEFARYLRVEHDKWAKVIRQAGIKAEQ
jgi:tripartite-type tricarboxylate transporter receptor subunit TctC